MGMMDLKNGKLVHNCPRCDTYNDMTPMMLGDKEIQGKLIEDKLYTMWEAMCGSCGCYYQTGVPYPAEKKEEVSKFDKMLAGDKAELMKVARDHDMDMEITHAYIWPGNVDMGKSTTQELLIGMIFKHDEIRFISYGVTLFEMIHELGYGIRGMSLEWGSKKMTINIGKFEEI